MMRKNGRRVLCSPAEFGDLRRICRFGAYPLFAMFVFLHVAIANEPAQFPVQEDVKREKEKANCSIFKNVILNAEAWQQGDFLVREHRISDSVNRDGDLNLLGATIEIDLLTRISFDFSKNRFRIIKYGKTRLMDLSRQADGDNPWVTSTLIEGVCIPGDGSIASRNFPDKKQVRDVAFHRMVGANPGDLMNLPTVPDYRCVGFPILGIPRAFDRLKTSIEWYASGSQFEAVRDTALGSEITLAGPKSSDSDLISLIKVEFCSESNLPIKWVTGWRSTESTVPNKEGEIWESSTIWKDLAGVYVPDQFTYSCPAELVNFGTRQEKADVLVTLEFQWFSFNEQLPDDTFESSCLDSIDQITDLVNPEKSRKSELDSQPVPKTGFR